MTKYNRFIRRFFHSAQKTTKMDTVFANTLEEARGIENEIDQELLENIKHLKECAICDVMVPRADIIAIPHNTTLDEIHSIAVKKRFWVYPIFENNLDDIVGYIHVKDILTALQPKTHKKINDLLRKPIFVAPSMRLIDVLIKLRENQQHMALVVDEFGGVDGLVTLEDLVKEVLEAINATPDNVETTIKEEGAGKYLINARASLEEVFEKTGITVSLTEEENDIDTIGGYISFFTGRVPSRGEIINLEKMGEIEIIDADPRRIKWVRLKLNAF